MELVASHLSVARGGRLVIADLSLTVAGGEALTLTGPNGSGKTTLLKALGGLIAPEAGSVTMSGGSEELSPGEQSHLFAHRDAVKSAMTLRENAHFWASYLGGGAARVGPALERLGLDTLSDVPAAYLSAGQRRRLGLARLLLADRPIWLLDEPSVSLDAASVETLVGMVAEHLAGGGLVIAATHIPLGIGAGGGARELRLVRPASEGLAA